MRRGARDYVFKDRLDRLVPVVRRALQEADERAARRRAELWRDGQNRLLELVATGASLTDTLSQLMLTVESQAAGMLCSILLLDADRRAFARLAPRRACLKPTTGRLTGWPSAQRSGPAARRLTGGSRSS